jgi:DNA repair exonuclease SbcCD ATPase subunit
MAVIGAACRLLALVSLMTVAQGAGTPINKVVEMLQGMMKKGKALKIQERVEFSKFSEYCDTTRKDTQKAIETGADNIVQQTAAIGKALSDAEALAEDIKDVQADTAKMENQLAEATSVRKKERADYEAMHKDFTESIEAIAKATKVLKEKAKDVPQSLLQVSRSPLIPAHAKAAIRSFLAVSEYVEEEAPPKAEAYEAQSGGVIAILEKLKLKFEDQKTTLEKEEASTKANFELLKQKMTDSIADAKDTESDKTAAKAKKMETASDTKSDLEVTKKGKGADEKKLSDLNVECDLKAKEYDKNQVTRAEEIKAMETAVGILSSDTVSGTAEKHEMVLTQDDATSFAFLQVTRSADRDKRRQLVKLLQGKANALGSRYLSLVASRAVTDPMMKVKKMIKDLIVKLMEEANSEADQKGYCDSELGANKVTRDGKTAEVDDLTANIERLTADLAKLTLDIASLSQEVSDLRSSQDKATGIRNEEKATNTKTISEAKSAQVAVERATTVLRDFYGKAKESASLLQDTDSVSEDMDQVANAPYKGMQDQKGGVIGMLEVVLSDFAKLESTTASAEDEAEETYTKFMDDTTQDIAVKNTELDHMEKKSETTAQSIRSLKKELKATQEELDAALAYYEKLRPDCVDTGLSFQDRVEMRQAEIQSLQEALKVLSE